MSEIFRVYEPFHDSDESGTVEYGIYSSHEKALARLEQVWEEKEYPAPDEKYESGWYAYYLMDTYRISIDRIELDKNIEDKNVGYT